MEQLDYVNNAIKEIVSPEFAYTKQILEVNKVEIENGQFKIEKIIEHEKKVDVFFNIKDEPFFLHISLNKENGEVMFSDIQNSNCCYLMATSEIKSLDELAAYTKIKYTKGYSQGDIVRISNKQKIMNHSCIEFKLLDTNCYETEEAIAKLLDKFSEDKEGIKNLIRNSDAVIEICKYQYISANAGLSLSTNLIKRLSEFRIGIDIDTYIVGKEFIS